MTYLNRIATVIGGSGFIGRHVVRRLAATGAVIRVATRHPSRAQFLRVAGTVGQIVPIATHLGSDDSVKAAVDGADLVVNLVGILFETRGNGFEAVQVEGAARVARLAREAGVRQLVHVSAISRSTTSAYARTKAEGEKRVQAAFPGATILRPSVVFGPEDNFFNQFAALAMVSPVLPLIGGGNTLLQPVYVGDVADAVMAALARPEAAGRLYELGGPRVMSFRAAMETMLAILGRQRRLVPVPWAVAEALAGVFGALPRPPLTRDQVELLKSPCIVAPDALTLADLGIAAHAVEVMLPTWVDPWRVGGRYTRGAGASV